MVALPCHVVWARKHEPSAKSQKRTECTGLASCRLAPVGFVKAAGKAGLSLARLVPLLQAAAAVARAGRGSSL